MYTIINIESPIQSAIVLYILLLAIIFMMKPKIVDVKNRRNKIYLPIIILIVSVISYYIFALLNRYFVE